MSHELLLPGIDGSNPLAFLAALGTLRTFTLALPAGEIRMSWREHANAWRPVLHAAAPLEQAAVVETLCTALEAMKDHPAFALGENLNVPPEHFQSQARQAQQASSPVDRRWADFLAAFGCETTILDSKKPLIIQDTALRTMSGTGHQDFLAIIRNIVRKTGAAHLVKALFAPWRYDDPMKMLNMRWDPLDDRRYALRGHDPGEDPTRNSQGSVLGANRLAIEALPLMPTAPQGTKLCTTGFVGSRSRDTFWTWPLWSPPLNMDVVRSLVALDLLQDEQKRDVAITMGCRAFYRSQRLTIDKYRNFSPAQAV